MQAESGISVASEGAQGMSDEHKLKVFLDSKTPRRSKVVVASTGEEIFVTDIHIHVAGTSSPNRLRVQITLENPWIEVIAESPDDPLGVSALTENL